jgi:hypothetical protein
LPWFNAPEYNAAGNIQVCSNSLKIQNF